MAQCDDIHKILLNNLTSIKSHPESLRYLSLRFLSPHRYNGGEWNIICGAHSFENEKNSTTSYSRKNVLRNPHNTLQYRDQNRAGYRAESSSN